MSQRRYARQRIFLLLLFVIGGFAAFIHIEASLFVEDPSVLLQTAVGVGVPFFSYVIYWGVMRVHRVRAWTAAATEIGLTPTGEGYLAVPLLPSAFDRFATAGKYYSDDPFVLPCYEGTVNGHEVRVSTGRRKCVKGTETTWRQFTVVETDLERDAAEHDGAIVVNDTDREAVDTGQSTYPVPITEFVDTEADGLSAAGTDDHLAKSLITDEAGTALSALDNLFYLFAGDAKAVYDSVPDDQWDDPYVTIKTVLDAHDEEARNPEWVNGTQTVTLMTSGTIADAEKLEAMADAVVTLAGTFEEERRW